MYSMAVSERRATGPGHTGWCCLPDVITQGGIPNQWWFKLCRRAVNCRSSAAVVWTTVIALQQGRTSKARLGGCTGEPVSSSRVKATSSHKWEPQTKSMRFSEGPVAPLPCASHPEAEFSNSWRAMPVTWIAGCADASWTACQLTARKLLCS